MKTITYNVNGIRAAQKKGFLTWLAAQEADIVCLQEVKAEKHQVSLAEYQELGFEHIFWHSAQKKGYSGVAMLCKQKPDVVEYGCGNEIFDVEGRVLIAHFKDFAQMCVYMPSGTTGDIRQNFKMEWLEFFSSFASKVKDNTKNLIISGDFNICHTEIDIHNPKSNAKSSGFLPEERIWMTTFFESGFMDAFRYLCKEPHHYTWWSSRPGVREKNMGWRIDYHACSLSLLDRIRSCSIMPEAVHSDHCPVVLILDI